MSDNRPHALAIVETDDRQAVSELRAAKKDYSRAVETLRKWQAAAPRGQFQKWFMKAGWTTVEVYALFRSDQRDTVRNCEPQTLEITRKSFIPLPEILSPSLPSLPSQKPQMQCTGFAEADFEIDFDGLEELALQTGDIGTISAYFVRLIPEDEMEKLFLSTLNTTNKPEQLKALWKEVKTQIYYKGKTYETR